MTAHAPVALDKIIRVPEMAMARMINDSWIGLDLETSGLSPWKDKIAVITLYGKDSRETAVLHVRGRIPEPLKAFLSDPRRNFITHNGGGFDMLFLATHGVDIQEPTWYDTLVGEGCALVSNRRDVSRSLQASLQRRLKVEVKKDQRLSNWMQVELTPEQVEYCADDVRHLPNLMASQQEKVAGTTQERALLTELRLLPVVAKMSLNGLPFDEGGLEAYLADGAQSLLEESEWLFEKFGRPINLGSVPQLKAALADLRIFLPSTDKEHLKILELYGAEEQAEVAEHLLKWKYGAQRKKMYTPEWVKKYVTDGWVHARFWQVGTDTGRFSSSEPNLQQVPGDMRFLFGNLPGYKIVSVDYSQIEVRVAAKVANDQVLLQALNEEDIHTAIAAQIFDKKPEDVSKAERKMSKAMSFTLLFGGGAGTLYDYSRMSGGSITKEECQELVSRFFGRFRGIAEMKRKAKMRADWRSPVPITLPTGLRRILVGDTLTATRLLNTVVQGSAAAGLKYGILEASDRGLDDYLGATVHDELVSAVPTREAEEYGHELSEAMIAGMLRAIPDTPVKVEAKIGDTWK